MECRLKYVIIAFSLLYTSLLTAAVTDVNQTVKREVKEVYTLNQLQDVDASTEVHAPVFYRDYDWDLGLIGGMTMDGTQTEPKRFTMGIGLHGAYHYNESVTFHGEYVEYFKTFTNEDTLDDATNRIMALSAAFDFSADRTYSLFAKGGLGYEMQSKYDTEYNNPISLMGFGFRYMFTDQISGYIEGRWKFVLVHTETPDNSLVGTVGLDYHFGLSDTKGKLIESSSQHNNLLKKTK